MPPTEPSTYILVLRCPSARAIRVGRLGSARLRPGYYLYVGSAHGPGGLRARIGHHRRGPSGLTAMLTTCADIPVWNPCGYASGARREHEWAAKIAAMPEAALALRDFGISDCRCATQLVGGCADRDGVTTMLGGESAAVTGQNENS